MDPSFQKDFLRDFQRRNSGPVLALFGKHPAWDDHMEDFGLTTDSLRWCKRLLYINGIAANAARQQSLSGEQKSVLFPYRHFLLWFRAGEMILIRMVESEDGRGRAFFPLVAAVHIITENPEESLASLLVPLRTFVDECRVLNSRGEVDQLHRHVHENLQSTIRRIGTCTARRESATCEEVEEMRKAATRTSFLRATIPVTRYDPSVSFGVLTPIITEQPVLLTQRDGDLEIKACLGQPSRDDFWFLRENGCDLP